MQNAENDCNSTSASWISRSRTGHRAIELDLFVARAGSIHLGLMWRWLGIARAFYRFVAPPSCDQLAVAGLHKLDTSFS